MIQLHQEVYISLTGACYASKYITKIMNDSIYSLAKFKDYITENYYNYLVECRYYYSSEQRWKDSGFWNKLQQVSHYKSKTLQVFTE